MVRNCWKPESPSKKVRITTRCFFVLYGNSCLSVAYIAVEQAFRMRVTR